MIEAIYFYLTLRKYIFGQLDTKSKMYVFCNPRMYFQTIHFRTNSYLSRLSFFLLQVSFFLSKCIFSSISIFISFFRVRNLRSRLINLKKLYICFRLHCFLLNERWFAKERGKEKVNQGQIH